MISHFTDLTSSTFLRALKHNPTTGTAQSRCSNHHPVPQYSAEAGTCSSRGELGSTAFMLIASGRPIPARPLCPRKSLGLFMAADSVHPEAPFWNVLLPLPVVYSCIDNEEQLKDRFLLFLITDFQLGVEEAPMTSPGLRDEKRPLCPRLEGAGKPSRDSSLLYETGLPARSETPGCFFMTSQPQFCLRGSRVGLELLLPQGQSRGGFPDPS
ncbi:uncharacterized protein LOC114064837 [Empidonax traillii]|uniref:uncharacterized protein LOC114064837 n=1 Tax=Empidonax traillii TaxID=164674 RepID=UPI000FFD6D39|nr:uncharacterized protein LOC114064837 [Empidonax traillii]